MCRFILYVGPELTLGDLITRPRHSLVHQSFHAEERIEPLNGDGFGVAWYSSDLSDEPARFRSVTPAWSNQNLHSLCRVTRSGCVLAHVRAASPGLAVTEPNCHPFVSGRLALMHNGGIAQFLKIKRALQAELSDAAFEAIEGTTDSEHLLALFLDRFAQIPGDGTEAMAQALSATLERAAALMGEHGIDEPSTFNVAVSNGDQAVVSRFACGPNATPPSLYLHEGLRYVCDGDSCRMVAPEGRGAVLVSSERLSDDPGWKAVPANHLVLIEADGRVELRPIA